MDSILIIDDNPKYAEPLATFFSNKGYEVSTACTKEKGEEEIEKKEFDLIILDLALKGDDSQHLGFYLLDLIKIRCPLSMVIVLSGYPDNRKKTLEKGAFDFIDKTDPEVDLRSELLIKTQNALMLKSLNLEKIEREIENAKKEMSGLDDKGYLTITTDKLINKLKDDILLTDWDGFGSLPDSKKFRILTERISEKYIRKIAEITFPDVRSNLHYLIVNSCQMDVLLYLTQKRYRDHYKHQFLVGALGWFFLDISLPNGLTIRKQIEAQTGLLEDDINQAWWMAALLHDHGYPLSYILKSVREINRLIEINEGGSFIGKMKDIYNSYDRVFSKCLLYLIEEMDLRVIQKNLCNWINCFIPSKLTPIFNNLDNNNLFDHGIVGAVNIVNFLKESLHGNQSDVIKFIAQNRWVQEGLCAIAFHNNLSLSPELTFEEYPIAFLLKLCDELQEWDRKTFYKEHVEGELLTETDYIKIGSLQYNKDSKTYAFKDDKACLSVLFEYRDPEKLEKTGWNLSLFEESKKRNLSSLKINNSFLSSLSFEVAKLNRIAKA